MKNEALKQIDNFDKEATKEAKALSWMVKNVKSKIPRIKSKIFGVRGSQFWKVQE